MKINFSIQNLFKYYLTKVLFIFNAVNTTNVV